MAPVESTNVSVYLGMCSVSSMPFRYAAIRQVYLLVYLRLPEIAGYSRKTASGFILETSRFRWKIAKNGGFPTEVRWRSGLLPDLFGQVAHFVFHLAKDHSFADGNKRTAMSVSLALLDKEGINLAIDDDADPAENTLYKLISALVTEIITEETFVSEFRNAGRVSGLPRSN